MHAVIAIRVHVCIYTLWSHMGGNFLYELKDGICVHFHTMYIK